MSGVHDHAVEQFFRAWLRSLQLVRELLIIKYGLHFIKRTESSILLAGIVLQFLIVNGHESCSYFFDVALELLEQVLGLFVDDVRIELVLVEGLQI